MVLKQDFKELIQSINVKSVRYLVIGGNAVAFHGHPRYTKAIDLWKAMDAEKAANIVKAVEQFGFASMGLQASDFIAPDQIVQFGYPPFRIDLITITPGEDFEPCYSARFAAK